MKVSTQTKGRLGENLAIRFLNLHGFKICDRNFRSRYGEIDIIAQKNESIYFVEVKYRQDQSFGQAIESIHHIKQRKLFKMSWVYLYQNPYYLGYCKRFAVLGIQKGATGISYDFIDNAFEVAI